MTASEMPGMMRTVAAILFSMGCACSGDEGEFATAVVMKRDVSIPDKGAALQRVQRSDVLHCPASVAGGYLVLARDMDGKSRMGFLPLRNEWGHATAKAWIHDPAMEKNTVVVEAAVPLEPGYALLKRGDKYPLVAATAGSDRYEILYTFKDFSRKVLVSSADAESEPPRAAETDPAKLRIAKLEEMLDQSKKEQDSLQLQLQQAEERREKLASLLGELDQGRAEKERLAAEVAKCETVIKDLVGFTPRTEDTRKALSAGFKALVDQQGKISGELEKSQIELAALKTLHAQSLAAESELERLRTSAKDNLVELRVLMDYYADHGVLQKKKHLSEALRSLVEQQSKVLIEMRKAQLESATLTNLHAQTVSAESELRELRTAADKADAEIKAVTDYYTNPAVEQKRKALSDNLKRMAEQQSKILADLQKTQLESVVLTNLHAQTLSAESELRELRAVADKADAELKAVTDYYTNPDANQKKEDANAVLERVSKSHAATIGRLQQLQASKDMLTLFYKVLQDAAADTKRLQDAVAKLTAEVEDLWNKIKSVEDAPKQ